MLKNSSEIMEAVELFTRLTGFASQKPVEELPVKSVVEHEEKFESIPETEPEKTITFLKKSPDNPVSVEIEDESQYTDDKLGNVLMRMCKRGDFSIGIVFDKEGFMLAKYGKKFEDSIVSALASILGTTQDKVRATIESPSHGAVSVDLDFMDKMVLARFDMDNSGFYLLVVCAQDRDVSEEFELTISEIKTVLVG
jgi:hypothetical protein